jgi:acetyl-CoA carboxylase biotin carboxyl carrier protein
MTIEEIKELLLLFNESGVGELELQRGENRLRLRRAGMDREYLVTPGGGIPHTATHAAAPSAAHALVTHPPSGTPAHAAESDSEILVKSPIVGTYYDAPSPGAAPFVKVGDAVEPGQVLCIIESMKLMNEIEAEVAGLVAAKLVENGRPVEYGEALLAVRPR